MRLAAISAITLVASFAARASTPIEGQVTGVLDEAGSPYIVTGNLSVPAGTTLTIRPGVVLRFSDRATFVVFGKLTAEGAAGSPITFTADTTLARGAWGGIGVRDGGTVSLSYAVIRYAGLAGAFPLPGASPRAAALFAYRANLSAANVDVGAVGGDAVYYQNDGPDAHTLSVSASKLADAGADGVNVAALNPADTLAVAGNTISGNHGYAYRMPAGALNRLGSGNTLSANAAGDGAAVTGGALVENTTLPAGLRWWLLGDLTVPPAYALDVQPGNTLRFRTGVRLQVDGSLTAAGTAASPIAMAADTGLPWAGIGFGDGASGNFAYTSIASAGYPDAFPVPGSGDFASAAIFAYRASVSLDHVSISGSEGDGLNWRNDAAPRALSISACTISGAARDGIAVESDTAGDAASISGTTVSGSGRYPIRVPARRLAGLAGNSVAANPLPMVALSAGTLSTSAAMDAGARYRVLDPISVAPGATLTVGAGAVVDFGRDAYLDVFGSLNTLGSPASPVAFTSAADSQQPGDWGGIGLEAGSAGSLASTSIRYAGGPDAFLVSGLGLRPAALLVNRATLTATGVTCSDSAGHGLFSYSPDPDAHTLSVAGSTFTACALDGVHLEEAGPADTVSIRDCAASANGGYGIDIVRAPGPVTVDGISAHGNALRPVRVPAEALSGLGALDLLGNAGGDVVEVGEGTIGADASAAWPLALEGSVSVAPGAVLRLSAGTSVQMPQAAALRVYGTLRAAGTPARPVSFLADSDTQTAGWWAGIGFAPGSTGDLACVDVQSAGALFDLPGLPTVTAAVAANGASVSMSGCLLRNGRGTLLLLRGTALNFTATNCTFLDNAAGQHTRLVDAGGSGAVTLGGAPATGCDFSSAQPDAVRAAGPATVFARWCSWNSPDGPAPAGSGAGISGPVDAAPWSVWPVNVPVVTGAPGSGDLTLSGTLDPGDAALSLRVAGGLSGAHARAVSTADVRPKPGPSDPVGDGALTMVDAVAILKQARVPGPVWP